MTDNVQNYGIFVPATSVWNTSEIYAADLEPKLERLLVSLYQNLNNMALSVNRKDSGFYPDIDSYVNGQLFFPNAAVDSMGYALNPNYRQVFRKVINFGALPNSATKSVAHGIPANPNLTFTRIYGTANDPATEYLPLPYSSASSTANNIELNVDPTNVNIITVANYSAYTITYVILEWITS